MSGRFILRVNCPALARTCAGCSTWKISASAKPSSDPQKHVARRHCEIAVSRFGSICAEGYPREEAAARRSRNLDIDRELALPSLQQSRYYKGWNLPTCWKRSPDDSGLLSCLPPMALAPARSTLTFSPSGGAPASSAVYRSAGARRHSWG